MAVDRNTLFSNLGNTIDPTDEKVVLAGAMDTWSAGVPFQRAAAVPLEKYSLFPTKAAAETYASKNPVAYPGQVIMVVDAGAEGTAGKVTPYVIKQDGGLGELATTAYADAVKQEVLDAVGNPFHFEKVDALPEKSAAKSSVLYLVPNSSGEGQNSYDEYLYVGTAEGGDWEKIGSTTIDLSGYLTKEDFNTKMGTIEGTVADALAGKVNSSDVQGTVSDSNLPVSGKAVQTELAKKADAERVGTLETTVTEHTGDGDIHVTAEQKQEWSGKQDKVTETGLLKGTGDGVTAAVAGTDYVAPEEGKGLSESNYTAAEKTKLEGVEAGANKTIVDAALSATSSNPVANSVVNTALETKVTKEDGKGLSTNDYDNDAKAAVEKIAGMEQTLGEKANASALEDYVLTSSIQSTVQDNDSPVSGKAVKAEIDGINETIGNINSLLDSLNGEIV